MCQDSVLTIDRLSHSILHAWISQPTTWNAIGQCHKDLELSVAPKNVVIRKLHSKRDIFVELRHKTAAGTGRRAALGSIADEVVAANVPVDAISSNDRKRTANLGVKACVRLLSHVRSTENERIFLKGER